LVIPSGQICSSISIKEVKVKCLIHLDPDSSHEYPSAQQWIYTNQSTINYSNRYLKQKKKRKTWSEQHDAWAYGQQPNELFDNGQHVVSSGHVDFSSN